MSNVVSLVTRPKPPRGEQRTIYRISQKMYLLLKEFEDAEKSGKLGLPVWADPINTLVALKRRGLIAHFEARPDDDYYCLSPKGRKAITSWESKRSM